MNLIPWRKHGKASKDAPNNEHPLDQFRTEMDRLMEHFFGNNFWTMDRRVGGLGEWNPSVDVAETEKEIVVTADVPGVKPEELNVSLHENTLTIEGKKEEKAENKEGNVHRVERTYGSFRRSIPLTAVIKETAVTAKTHNGVVTIRLPKEKETPKQRIPVEKEG